MTDAVDAQRVVLVRHGATDWAQEGRHTGQSDIPLNARGEAQARTLGPALAEWHFQQVWCSDLVRARHTCELAGMMSDAVTVTPLMREWHYGAYEGLTTAEIQQQRPGWAIWKDGVRDGESVDDVGARADRVIAAVREAGGDVCLFAHGHFLRILASRWCDLPPVTGSRFSLSTASISILGSERGIAGITRWNEIGHLREAGLAPPQAVSATGSPPGR